MPDNFKIALEAQVQQLLFQYVGEGGAYSDPINFIKKWDKRLTDYDIQVDLPLVAIMSRQATQRSRPSGEIGTSRELWDWVVDIYYFDVEQVDFDTGYARQADIVSRMINALENETRLGGLSVAVNPTSPTGAFNQYVYNNDWTSVVWSHSGQDEYWAYAAEMHLIVNTARN